MVLPTPRGQHTLGLEPHLFSCPDPGHVTKCFQVCFFLKEASSLRDFPSPQTGKLYVVRQSQWQRPRHPASAAASA